jgi:hypothetical protein
MLSFLKNFESSSLLVIIPTYLLMNVALSVVWTLQGNYKNAGSLYKAIFWNIAQLQKTMRKRGVVQRKRKVSDVDYLKKSRRNPDLRYYVALLTRNFENYVDAPL